MKFFVPLLALCENHYVIHAKLNQHEIQGQNVLLVSIQVGRKINKPTESKITPYDNNNLLRTV